MKNKAILFIAAFLGMQFVSSLPIIAETNTGIGSEEFSQQQNSLIIDSTHTQEPPADSIVVETMVATYYSGRFHGNRTASGERYNRNDFTCAHRTLPFNTILKVTNPQNHKSVSVRVNDRGPFTRGRHLDLSFNAAKELGMLNAGVIEVQVEYVKQPCAEDSLLVKNSKN